MAYVINEDHSSREDIQNISNSQYIKSNNLNDLNEIFINNDFFDLDDNEVSLNKTQKIFRK